MSTLLYNYIKGAVVLVFLVISNSLYAQRLHNVSSSGEEQLTKKHKYFSIIETKQNLALGQKCVSSRSGSDLPYIYFQEAVFTPDRAVEIHLFDGNNQNMVLEHNKSENDIFFVKTKFVVGNYSKSWYVIVSGHSIMLKNCSSHKYLAINAKGDFYPVQERTDASHFELIHHI